MDKTKDSIEKIDLSNYVSPRKPFGLATNFINSEKYHSEPYDMLEPIICYARGWKKGYVEKSFIPNRTVWIDKWKVYIPRANNIGTELPDDNLNTKIGRPGTICTESYLVIGADLNLNESSASNLATYLKTKFVRYMHSLAKASQDATSKTFRFVPLQDFTSDSDIDWSVSSSKIDQQLYDKYNLSHEEISFIESNIKEMD